MTDHHDTYLGIPLERWKDTMVCHLRDERKRNQLLQQRLDDANAAIADLQNKLMDRPHVAPVESMGLNVRRAVDRLIDRALEATSGDKTAAGRLLGMHRDSVNQHIKKRESALEMAS